MQKKHQATALFFLEGQRLNYFSEVGSTVHTLTFTPEAVLDLEVQNKKALERLLDNWLSTHQIYPGDASLIIADDAYFIHDSAQIDLTPEDEEYKHFLSFVPFDDAMFKTFPLTQGSRTVAVSKEFLNPIIELLEAKEFVVVSVSPDFVFADILKSKAFTAETAGAMLENLKLAETYSFISREDRERKLRADENFMTFRMTPKILIGVGVFVLLLAILGFLVWQMYGSPSKQEVVPLTQETVLAEPVMIVSPAPEAELTPATDVSPSGNGSEVVRATSSAVQVKSIRVRVVAAVPNSEETRAIVAQLEQEGMSAVLSTATGTAPENTIVVISPSVSSTQREQLRSIVSAFYPTLVFQENSDLNMVDAVVTLSN